MTQTEAANPFVTNRTTTDIKNEAAATVSEATTVAKQKVQNLRTNMEDYMQRSPYQALAIAAGIGFVAGLIIKRR